MKRSFKVIERLGIFTGTIYLFLFLGFSYANERIPDRFEGGEVAYYDKRIGETCIGLRNNNFDKIELGDEVYGRWTKPNLPYPWDLSKEEREKLSAEEYMRRYFWGFGKQTYCKTYESCACFKLIDRRGHIRKKVVKQWYIPYMYRKDSEAFKAGIMGKALFLTVAPEDARGLAIMDWTYFDDKKSDDFWLYLPSLRKVRRMSEGSKQDSFMGSDLHNDDLFMNVTEYNHKFLKSEIYKADENIFGLEKQNLNKFVNGIGRDCWVIETKSKRSWYYDKMLTWHDKDNFIIYKTLKYDKKGKLIITIAGTFIIQAGVPYTSGAKDYYTFFNWFPANDLRSNHVTVAEQSTANWDIDFPEGIWSTRHMMRGVY